MNETILAETPALTGGWAFLALSLVVLVSAARLLPYLGRVTPGTIVVIGAGVIAGAGMMEAWQVLLAAGAGAFAGSLLAYSYGRRRSARASGDPGETGGGSRRWRDWIRRIRLGRLDEAGRRADELLARRGAAGVVLSPFVPSLKSAVPVHASRSGIGPVRFALFAALSAILWAALLVGPAALAGSWAAVLGAANPRLVVLTVILITVLVATYRIVRLAAGIAAPLAIAALRQVSALAVAAGLPGARTLDAVAHDRGGILTPIIWVAVAGFAVAGFVDLAFDLATGGSRLDADQTISNLIQSVRTTPADTIMVAVTMAGDGVVLGAVAIVVLVGLLLLGEWRIAAAAALTVGAAALFVPFIKGVLQRPRPQDLYSGADAFSFPSGHATLSMAILGVVAVLLAHRLQRRHRLIVYAGATTMAVAIAFSRVYLAAHWPSDVAAGLLFGAAVVSAFALSLHNRTIAAPIGPLALAVGLTYAGAYGFHMRGGYEDWSRQYAFEAIWVTQPREAWLAGGWQDLPSRRIEFSGETGEPIAMQTDLGAHDVAAALSRIGWIVEANPGLGVTSLLPSGDPLSTRAPLPLFHDGRPPWLTAWRDHGDADTADGRIVMRLWPSGHATEGGAPILLGAITLETLRDIGFGLARIRDDAVPGGVAAAVLSDLDDLPGFAILRPDTGEDQETPTVIITVPPT